MYQLVLLELQKGCVIICICITVASALLSTLRKGQFATCKLALGCESVLPEDGR